MSVEDKTPHRVVRSGALSHKTVANWSKPAGLLQGREQLRDVNFVHLEWRQLQVVVFAGNDLVERSAHRLLDGGRELLGSAAGKVEVEFG